MSSFHPRRAVELIESEKVAIVATTWEMALLLSKAMVRLPCDISSLMVVGIGGAPVPADAVRTIRSSLDCDVAVSYGSTEAGAAVTVGVALGDDDGFIGRPIRGWEVKVVDCTGRRVSRGEIGELFYRRTDGPWVLSGDLARELPTGDLCVVGRRDDRVFRGGRNVNLSEIEAALLRADGVARAAVIHVETRPGRVKLCGFVVPEGGCRLERAAVTWHCRRHLDAYKVPDHIAIVDVIPTSIDGKVQRWRLEAEARRILMPHRDEGGGES
jgi:long-chain acyl-CoA synthetase